MHPPGARPSGDNRADRNIGKHGKARTMGSAGEGKEEDEREVRAGDGPSRTAVENVSVVPRFVGLTGEPFRHRT